MVLGGQLLHLLHPEDEVLNQSWTKAVLWVRPASRDPLAGYFGFTTWSLLDPATHTMDIDAQWVAIPRLKAWSDGAESFRFLRDGAPDTWASPPVMLPIPVAVAPAENLESDPYVRIQPMDVDAQRCVELFRGNTSQGMACDLSSDEVYVPGPESNMGPDFRRDITKVQAIYMDTDDLHYHAPDRGWAFQEVWQPVPE